MKVARYSDSQIMAILKQAETGSTVSDLCCEHGMSFAFFYKWCAELELGCRLPFSSKDSVSFRSELGYCLAPMRVLG